MEIKDQRKLQYASQICHTVTATFLSVYLHFGPNGHSIRAENMESEVFGCEESNGDKVISKFLRTILAGKQIFEFSREIWWAKFGYGRYSTFQILAPYLFYF